MSDTAGGIKDHSWHSGYANGYDDGARGHLPDSVLMVVLPEGHADEHAQIIEDITKYLAEHLGKSPDVVHFEGGSSK